MRLELQPIYENGNITVYINDSGDIVIESNEKGVLITHDLEWIISKTKLELVLEKRRNAVKITNN